ncbi:HD-GYP domain-containing protein [Sporosarcina sp. BI001-red]|uniref:HD-GYP domain-containing protein n=1 Tax=Sporosarcina sp. BI001-red TaxID=2282866 RepID=UPI000E249E78|nr:HD-GYP domain-containing protein [Sporosarcina sp. BI001-red]REB08168.1 HD-GYP domain-containing protein [Sporosarcina sp. BI001-red]
MENYRNLSELRPGTTIVEDIYANTAFPIIRKGTTLEIEHLEVLDLFNIKRVKVEERIVNRVQSEQHEIGKTDTISSDLDELLENKISRSSDLHTMYKKAVNDYKREFTSWRSGVKLDIAKVRLLIMPLLETYMEQKKMLVMLNEYSNRKEYLYHHAVSVGILTAALASELDYPKGTTLQLGLAGTLTDCGMAKVNPALLEKAAFLTKDEFAEVKKHPVYSYQMMQDSPLLRQEMKLAVLQHHERLDGSGYPRGDQGEKISQLSQILAVADVFHAMTCERVYRAKESPYRVAEMMKEEDFGKFDSAILDALYAVIGMPDIGDKVLLTNGDVGEVVSINYSKPLRPNIKLQGRDESIDLCSNRSVAIEKVVN